MDKVQKYNSFNPNYMVWFTLQYAVLCQGDLG
jgi:hypothetical protein